MLCKFNRKKNWFDFYCATSCTFTDLSSSLLALWTTLLGFPIIWHCTRTYTHLLIHHIPLRGLFFLSLFIFRIEHSKQSIRQREVPSFLYIFSPLYWQQRFFFSLSLSCAFSPGKRFTHSIFRSFFVFTRESHPNYKSFTTSFVYLTPPSQVEHFRIAPFSLPFSLRFENLSFCALYVPAAVSPISASTLFSFRFWYLQSLQLKLPQ